MLAFAGREEAGRDVHPVNAATDDQPVEVHSWGARSLIIRAVAMAPSPIPKPNLAKLTIARKVAAAYLAMWKNKEVYGVRGCKLSRGLSDGG